MVPPAPPVHICWICKRPVPLETCKTDEHGRTVHEACQFLRIAAKPPDSVKFKGGSASRHR